MRAVAPQVYNNWRDMLLSELYMRSLKTLEHGGREATDPARRLALVKAAVREELVAAKAPDEKVSEFLDRMPDRYFLTVPEGDVRLHFDMMRAVEELPLVCRHRHFPDLEFSEFMVVTHDQPGLFSKIAGALTANNLNILSARITTRDDGLALDVFRVSHLGGAGAIAMDGIAGRGSSATWSGCSRVSRTSRRWSPIRNRHVLARGNLCGAWPARSRSIIGAPKTSR